VVGDATSSRAHDVVLESVEIEIPDPEEDGG
jgi:hypothetical protein